MRKQPIPLSAQNCSDACNASAFVIQMSDNLVRAAFTLHAANGLDRRSAKLDRLFQKDTAQAEAD